MVTPLKLGPNSFRVQIRRSGEKPITRTFKTEEEAERFIAEHEAPKPGELTVAAAVQTYRELRAHGARPINPKGNEEFMLRHLARDLGSVKVEALTPDRIRRWASKRASDGAGAATVGMELSKLGTVLRYASAALHVRLPDVVKEAKPLLDHVGLTGSARERDRRLTPEEEEGIFRLAPPWLADIVRFALGTGMRRGEIARIGWSDLDVDRRLIMIRDRKDPRKKSGNDQLIPLLGEAFEIVARQQRVDGEGRIFPKSKESISDTFKLICDALGIENLHFHDLRHEATSRLFEAGYSIEQVALVTGHKDWRHLRRYTNLKPELLHEPPRGTRPSSSPRPGSPPSGDPDRGS